MSTIQKRPKYNTVTLQLRYEAIKSILRKSKTNLDVAKELKATKNTVNGWVREKDKIYDMYNSNTRNVSVKKIKTSTRPQVDAALLQWFTNLRSYSVRVTGAIMIEKANQFATHFGLPATCEASHIYRWRDRKNI
jgi:hypothetical protein